MIRRSRLGRSTAERMLGGTAGGSHAGRDPLASVLAAAAAPPRDAEYAGEEAAVSAFLAEHLAAVHQSRRGQMIKSPLAKLLSLKAGALALALGAGGAALAASGGAFSASAHGPAHSTVSGSAGSHENAGMHAAARASAAGTQGGASVSGRAPAAHILSVTDAAKACRSLAGQVHALVMHTNASTVQALTQTGLESALASSMVGRVMDTPAFASLVATAEGATNVSDYCGLLLHLAKLPVPGGLSKLPTSLLAGLPVPVVSQLPSSLLSGLPGSELSGLPLSFLSHLSAPALAGVLPKLPIGLVNSLLGQLPTGTLTSVLGKLPVSTLTSLLGKLPAGTLTSVLPRLPVSTLTQIPAGPLAGLLSKLPAGTLGGILPKLPSGLLSQLLPLLPSSLLSSLPSSLLSTLP